MTEMQRPMKFSRIYIEITNICNMSCSFCIGNTRDSKIMSLEEFEHIIIEISPYTEYIYLHVLGEPLMHPELKELLEVAYKYKMKVSITTNGTLLHKNLYMLQLPALRKVSVSVHSMEGKNERENQRYLQEVSAFALEAKEAGVLCELRIWNLGVDEISNVDTCQLLLEYLGIEEEAKAGILDKIEEKGSVTLMPKLFLGKAERFQWPSLEAPRSEKQDIYCHGIRSQLAILSDGTVVPCCLDSNGDIALGNIYREKLDEILSKEQSMNMYHGFSNRKPTEELCRRCGYATRF